jgi:hypothetical protein
MSVNGRTSRRRLSNQDLSGLRRQSILVLIVTYISPKRVSSLKHPVMRDNFLALVSSYRGLRLAQLGLNPAHRSVLQ